MKNTRKILITGATGFIGSHLTKRLIDEKFEVGIIKRKNSNIWRLRDILKSIKIYNADIQSIDEVLKTVSDFRPDVVLHLAAYYSVEHKRDEISDMVNTNVLGTVNLLESVKELKIKLFVNTSSCFVYESRKDKARENSPLNPLNLYALTKINAEEVCIFYSKRYGLQCVTFRIFPPYGPADHKRRLIPYIISKLLKEETPELTKGEQEWDFIYVDDIVDAYIALLKFPNLSTKHEIFNIGTGETVSVREVGLRLKEILNSKLELAWGAIPYRNNEVWFICADISKAKRILGWRPKTQILERGLEHTVKWYKTFYEKEIRKWEKEKLKA